MPAPDKLARVETAIVQNPFADYTKEQVDLIRQQVAKEASDLELTFFIHNAKRFGLDPLANQIYFIKRKGKGTIQVAIDGMRLIADRTKCYSPGSKSEYEYQDIQTNGGSNKRVLFSATAYVKKLAGGEWHEVSETAHWAEYVQVFWDKENRKEKVGDLWQKMPHVMLAKCAEARALRRAFPAELGGLYEFSEMTQAESTYDPSATERDLSHLAPGEENRGHGNEGMKVMPPKKSAKKKSAVKPAEKEIECHIDPDTGEYVPKEDEKVSDLPKTKSAAQVAAEVNATVGGATTQVGVANVKAVTQNAANRDSFERHTITFMHKNIKPLTKKLGDGGERRYLAITAASDIVYYCWHESLHEHLGRAASTDKRGGHAVTCLCRPAQNKKLETVYAIEEVIQIGDQIFKNNEPFNAEMEDDIAAALGATPNETESQHQQEEGTEAN